MDRRRSPPRRGWAGPMSLSLVALLLSLAAAAPPGAEPPSPAAAAAPDGSAAAQAAAQPAAPASAAPTLREVNLARAGKGLLPRKAPPRRAPRRLHVVSARDQVARAQQVGGSAAVELVEVATAAAAPELVPAAEPVPGAAGPAWIAGRVIRGVVGLGLGVGVGGAGGRGAEPGARVEAEPGGLRAGARVASVEVTVRVRAGALALAAGSPGAAVRPLR
ncbi:hypothetical protein Adeh_2093 [Anaeromyxobacter dehalogenans 2CP-C]|uniref:Uncharacterized protein n=2 Tax=Anaeromyxobacter dehalogenans TaxID=161493 RepID=Q2IJN6_ANADE|nr:hypothetical protein Adeh_2093 [Anaeromyxobacter dehalogenans 2CP-C]